MSNEKFIREIYEPYNEAYKLIKMIKDCGSNDSEEVWKQFGEMLTDFSGKYDTAAGHTIARMVTDLAENIAKENSALATN